MPAPPAPAAPTPQLVAALEQLVEGVIVADAAGRITFVNEAAARLHGVARLDVPPESYAESYHLLTEGGDPYPPLDLPLARAVLRGETVVDARWRVRRPDGTEVLAVGSARPVRDANGASLGAVLTVRDETAVAVAARAVRERDGLAERLRAAFDQSPLSTVVYDATGRPVAANPAFERLWGAGIADVPPSYSVLTDPQLEAAGVLPLIRRAFAGEVVTTPALCYDVSSTVGRGRRLWTQGHLYPVRDAAGRVEEVVLTHEDVTGRRVAEAALARRTAELEEQRLELELSNQQLQDQTVELEAQAEELRESAAELEERTEEAEVARARADEANRAKSQFLANMSHELRTPLNAIGGYAELLDMGLRGPVTEAQRADLRRVKRAQMHLLGLINDVLNLARIETGRVEYDVQPVALDALIADVAPMIEPQMTAKGLTFVVRPPPPALAVWADADKLRQVLLNVLSNAVKFTDAGGRIVLEVAGRADGSGPPDALFLRVADTGRGIRRDKLDAVFEPFVQLGRHLTAPDAFSQQGTGLGLSISRDLARGMGGDLRARSEEGRGSAFTLTLRRVVA